MISGDKSGEFGISSRAPCKDCLHIQSILRHGGLLREIIEDRMKGKPTRGKRRIQMQNNLANDGGFVALKRATAWGQRGVETQRKDVKNLLYSGRLLLLLLLMMVVVMHGQSAC